MMISTGCLTAFWMVALLTFNVAKLGETQLNSLNEPDVPFPPAYPVPSNLIAICTHGLSRPRYPEGFFQGTGASHFQRRGQAVNRLESWYGLCCSGEVAQDPGTILCCTQQAWKLALSQFCVEEYATKTLPYECCESKDDARWTCFNSELPNPNYSPTPGYSAPIIPFEPGFIYDASAC